MLTPYQSRQLRQGSTRDQLVALAHEMAQKKQVGLRVERQRLQVQTLEFLTDFDFLLALEVRGITRNLSTISSLKNLRSLALCEMAPADISFLRDLPSLSEIWLQSFRPKNWNSLSSLKQVQSMTFFNLRQDDFSFLADLEGLQHLRFIRCSRLEKLLPLVNFAACGG